MHDLNVSRENYRLSPGIWDEKAKCGILEFKLESYLDLVIIH
jgi:hypothetical protein